MNPSFKKGFTLVELLMVVFAISILTGIVLVLINPQRQLINTRNAQRIVDIRTIHNAIQQYVIDNEGRPPGPGIITNAAQEICRTTGNGCAPFLDLGNLTEREIYVVQLPRDPLCTIANSTCYTVLREGSRRLTVGSPLHEIYTPPTVRVSKWDIGVPMLFFACAFMGFFIMSIIVIYKRK